MRTVVVEGEREGVRGQWDLCEQEEEMEMQVQGVTPDVAPCHGIEPPPPSAAQEKEK